MQTALLEWVQSPGAVGAASGVSSSHKTQRDRILKLLKDADFVSTAQLRTFAYQYNARLFELRKEGYVIESCKVDGACGFRLLGFHFGRSE